MTTIAQQLDNVLALLDKATPDWRARAHGVVVGGEFNEYTNGKAQSQVASFTVMSNSDNAIGEQVANTELAVAAVNFLRQYGPAIRAAVGGEAVAWHTEDHLTDKSATTYDRTVAGRWINKGWPVTPLYASPPATVDVGALRDYARRIESRADEMHELGDFCARDQLQIVADELATLHGAMK